MPKLAVGEAEGTCSWAGVRWGVRGKVDCESICDIEVDCGGFLRGGPINDRVVRWRKEARPPSYNHSEFAGLLLIVPAQFLQSVIQNWFLAELLQVWYHLALNINNNTLDQRCLSGKFRGDLCWPSEYKYESLHNATQLIVCRCRSFTVLLSAKKAEHYQKE